MALRRQAGQLKRRGMRVLHSEHAKSGGARDEDDRANTERENQMKVLIIDDEEDTRAIAGMSLNLLGGLEVIEADCGEDGITKAAELRPDVILLDMMMPVMDGPHTLVKLQNTESTKDIPVIFLTAQGMQSEIDRLKQLGALGVLTKPFDPAALAGQVRQILGK